MILLEQVPTLEGDLSQVQQKPLFSGKMTPDIIILCIIIVVCIIALFYLTIAQKKNKNASETIFVQNKSKVSYNRILLLYNTLDNLPMTRRYLNRLRREFEMVAPGDARFAKERATWITLFTWGGGFLAGVLVLILKPTLFMLFIVIFTVYIVSQEAVNTIVEKNEMILMKQFLQFLSRFRYHYLIDNTVDDAIYDTMPEVPHLMQLHAKLMLQILQSEQDKMDEALLMYKNAISNLFLKQFLAICVTTMQNGDIKVDGQSLCLTNVKDLRVDVEIELRKRKDIKAGFSGATLMVCLPVYFMQAISNWGVKSISGMQGFYYGTLGNIVMMVCFVVTIAIYSYTNQLRETHHQKASEHLVLKSFCDLKLVKAFTRNYWNKNYGKKLHVEKTLRRTGSTMKPEHFLIYSMLLFIAAFVASVAVLISSNISVKANTESDFTAVASEATSGTEEQNVIMLFLTKYYFELYKDQDLLAMFAEQNGHTANGYDDEFKQWFNHMLEEQFEEGNIELNEETAIMLLQQYNQVNSASTMLYTKLFGTTGVPEFDETNVDSKNAFRQMRELVMKAEQPDPLFNTTGMYEIVEKYVLSKYQKYTSTYFHWWFMLIALLVAVAVFNMPMVFLHIKEADLQVVMQNEVLQYYSIILLLIYFENVNALTILEWLNIFAEIFESSISKCITEFTMDEKGALQKLYDSEPFEEFQRIVENLMMVDDVGVLQAFNELAATRKSNQETRSQDNKNVVAAHVARENLIMQIPLYTVVGGYLVIPMITQALSQMSALVTEMSAM